MVDGQLPPDVDKTIPSSDTPTNDLLMRQFKHIMGESSKQGIGILELTDRQITSICHLMRTDHGRIVYPHEVKLCFVSFRRQWWKEHRREPAVRKEKAPE